MERKRKEGLKQLVPGKANTCRTKANEIYMLSLTAVLAIPFFSGKTCWGPLQDRGHWELQSFPLHTDMGSPWFLATSTWFHFVISGGTKSNTFVLRSQRPEKLVVHPFQVFGSSMLLKFLRGTPEFSQNCFCVWIMVSLLILAGGLRLGFPTPPSWWYHPYG